MNRRGFLAACAAAIPSLPIFSLFRPKSRPSHFDVMPAKKDDGPIGTGMDQWATIIGSAMVDTLRPGRRVTKLDGIFVHGDCAYIGDPQDDDRSPDRLQGMQLVWTDAELKDSNTIPVSVLISMGQQLGRDLRYLMGSKGKLYVGRSPAIRQGLGALYRHVDHAKLPFRLVAAYDMRMKCVTLTADLICGWDTGRAYEPRCRVEFPAQYPEYWCSWRRPTADDWHEKLTAEVSTKNLRKIANKILQEDC